MQSLFEEGHQPPCPAPFNMAQYVLRCAAHQPTKTALSVVGIDHATDLSYADLEAAVLGVAQGFLDLGLKPQDIILLRLGNTVDFPICYLAAIAAGMVPVPSSSELTNREVDKIYQDLNPALVVHAKGIALGRPTCLVLKQPDLAALKVGPKAGYDLGDPNRPGYIVYTSGTSGQPRAVQHAHRAIWARQMMIRDWYDLMPTDRLLHAGAFNWTFTMGAGLLDPWSVGATSLILAPDTDLFALPQILRTQKASLFAAVPGVYRKLLHSASGDHDALNFPDLRHALSAGEKLSDRISDAWLQKTSTQIYEAFGMSECSTFISHAPNRAADKGALGQPQTGRRVAIVDDTGPVARGAVGQIAVHKSDPGLMLGYVNAPDATAERFQGDWFLTGDLGRMSDTGSIHYEGRADDMMNAGGFRVSPLEVETALASLPGVLQVGVTDVEIKADTRIIIAFLVLSDGVTPQDVERFANQSLARYKQPKDYLQISALPVNANGKLNRNALRTAYKASVDGSDQT